MHLMANLHYFIDARENKPRGFSVRADADWPDFDLPVHSYVCGFNPVVGETVFIVYDPDTRRIVSVTQTENEVPGNIDEARMSVFSTAVGEYVAYWR